MNLQKTENRIFTGIPFLIFQAGLFFCLVPVVHAADLSGFGSPGKSIPLMAAMICLLLVITAGLCLALWQQQRKIARHRRAQTRSQRHADRFRMLLENADDGILIIRNLQFIYANRKLYNLIGISDASKVSHSLVDYIHPDDLDIVLRGYEKTMIARETESHYEIRLKKPDGSILWADIRYHPAEIDGEPVDLAYIRDISVRKKMETDLHHAQRLEAIGALSGGIAHEFNNILTTIIGSAEIALMDLEEGDSGQKEFENIRTSGHRASDLVSQILTITRQHSHEIHPLNLSLVIREVLKLLRSTLPSNIRIIEKVDRNTDPVLADTIKIHQAFMNLCTNAVQALSGVEDPELEIKMENAFFDADHPAVKEGLRPGRYVTISVRDNGCGVDADTCDRLFDPYFTTKTASENIGLGLTTAMGIVKQFDGYLSFQSQEGSGSCFMIYLPAYRKKERPAVENIEQQAFPGNGGCILFVDDEKPITEIASKMFKNMGFCVMTANSGEAALDHLQKDPDAFDLLITDLTMPGHTGDWLAKKAMDMRPQLPVILCTGHSDIFDETKAMAQGVVEYIKKPYDLKMLCSIASKYIDPVVKKAI